MCKILGSACLFLFTTMLELMHIMLFKARRNQANAYVAVPCRNQRLFRCVFRSCCCIQSTVSLNLTHIHTSTKHIWAPLLSSAIQCFECSDAIKMCDGITFKFLHGTVTNSILTCVISVTVECLVWRWLPGFMLWQWSSYTPVPQETDGWRWASKLSVEITRD